MAATGDNRTAGQAGGTDLYDAANPPFAGLPEPLTSRSARDAAGPGPEEQPARTDKARAAAAAVVLLSALLVLRRRRRARKGGAG